MFTFRGHFECQKQALCSAKYVLLKISQNSQENTGAGGSFFYKVAGLKVL